MLDIRIERLGTTYAVPVPVFETYDIGRLVMPSGEMFTIRAGLDPVLVDQLRARSADDADMVLRANTSDRERFGDGSYEEWYSKGRLPFALVSESGALAALVWLGSKPLGRKSLKYLSDDEKTSEFSQAEKEWHTLVYRSYMPFRGRGLMRPFVRFCIDEYRRSYPDARLWVGMSASNEASARLAESLGFKKRDDLYDEAKNWQGMVLG